MHLNELKSERETLAQDLEKIESNLSKIDAMMKAQLRQHAMQVGALSVVDRLIEREENAGEGKADACSDDPSPPTSD